MKEINTKYKVSDLTTGTIEIVSIYEKENVSVRISVSVEGKFFNIFVLNTPGNLFRYYNYLCHSEFGIMSSCENNNNFHFNCSNNYCNNKQNNSQKYR